MGTRYNRPDGAYAGAAGLANRTKYADDAAGNVAISSAKVDGDLNYVVDALNEMDDARGDAPTLAARLGVALNADGTLKASVVAVVDDWAPVAASGLTRVGDATFRVSGDLRAKLTVNRRVRLSVGSAYLFADVAAVTLSGSQTTVDVVGLVDAAGAAAVLAATPTAVEVGPLVPGPAGNAPRRVDALSVAGFTLAAEGASLGVFAAGAGASAVRVGASGLSGLAPASVGVEALTTALLGQLVPVGSVLPYAGSVAPDGWLMCSGQLVSRTAYAGLFGVLGTTYGAGDGSTTFALPDLRGRAVFGKDNMGGTAAGRMTAAGGVDGTALGAHGGAETCVLTAEQIPAHSHTTSWVAWKNDSSAYHGGGTLQGHVYDSTDNFGKSASGTATTRAIGTQNAGGGLAHSILPPALVLNYMIKA